MDSEQVQQTGKESVRVEKSPQEFSELVNKLGAQNENFGGLLLRTIPREAGQSLIIFNFGSRGLPGYGVDEKSEALVIVEAQLASRLSSGDFATVEEAIKSLNPDVGTNIGAYMTDMRDDSKFIQPVVKEESYKNWLNAYHRAEDLASNELEKRKYVKTALEEASKAHKDQESS